YYCTSFNEVHQLIHTNESIMTTDKHIKHYLKNLAEEIDGKYTDYTDESVILTLPLDGGKRYQNVRCFLRNDEQGVFLTFNSKIVALKNIDVNLKDMLKRNTSFIYAKLVVTQEDEMLEMIASIRYDLCTYDEVRLVLFEIGQEADKLEDELTGGQDVY
ncbi:MAG: hypothetical protein AAF740_11700, partial [Bacteroidota bacterium]